MRRDGETPFVRSVGHIVDGDAVDGDALRCAPIVQQRHPAGPQVGDAPRVTFPSRCHFVSPCSPIDTVRGAANDRWVMELSSAQIERVNAVLLFARTRLSIGAREREAAARFDRRLWDEAAAFGLAGLPIDRKSTRLNSSHSS